MLRVDSSAVVEVAVLEERVAVEPIKTNPKTEKRRGSGKAENEKIHERVRPREGLVQQQMGRQREHEDDGVPDIVISKWDDNGNTKMMGYLISWIRLMFMNLHCTTAAHSRLSLLYSSIALKKSSYNRRCTTKPQSAPASP